MKFVLFNDHRPGLLQDSGVVDLSEAIHPLGARNGQEAIETIITHMDELAGENGVSLYKAALSAGPDFNRFFF